jgi:glycerol-3-phosphate dehydrogenase
MAITWRVRAKTQANRVNEYCEIIVWQCPTAAAAAWSSNAKPRQRFAGKAVVLLVGFRNEKSNKLFTRISDMAIHNGGRKFYPYYCARNLLANAAPSSHRKFMH